MRAFLAAMMLLLGVGSALPESEFASLFDAYFSPSSSDAAAALVDIDRIRACAYGLRTKMTWSGSRSGTSSTN